MKYFLSKRITKCLFLLYFILWATSCQKDLDSLAVDGSSTAETAIEEIPIKILSYNTFLLTNIPGVSTTQWSQTQRAERLANADFIKNYDVLLLQECLDPTASRTLRQKLETSYPYQTPILGSTQLGWTDTQGDWREIINGGLSNGGVMIASKYPIEIQKQYIFPAGCGIEALALKGFVYVRINKDGEPIHLFATHLQSTQPECGGAATNVRTTQLATMKSYVDQLQIPSDETVIYGGDFNVIKDSPEYTAMLTTLAVSAPRYKGLSHSWNNKTNTLAAYHYPYPATQPEHLDYIFVSNEHKVPSSWQNITFDPVSSSWMTYSSLLGSKYYWVDYSDHYPVEGNISSDEFTPNQSLKTRNYDRISLQSVATGKFIANNLVSPNDWLTVTSSVASENTWFNLANIHRDDANYFDLVEGKVRVESSERLNNFWYWQAINSKPYYYYPNFGTALSTLELVRVSKYNNHNSASIQNGDIVAFRDYSLIGTPYYLQVNNQAGVDRIYMNGRSAGTSEQFRVQFAQQAGERWQ